MMPTVTGPTTHTTIASDLGDLTVVGRDGAIVGLYFPHHWYRPPADTMGNTAAHGFDEVSGQLTAYLAGDRRDFDVPVVLDGDDRQQRVWGLLHQIPYGETVTYGALAAELGGERTPQEVGAAVGRNPVSIIVPCHRVVGAGGKLTGYAGGLERKRTLLDLEREVAGRDGRLF